MAGECAQKYLQSAIAPDVVESRPFLHGGGGIAPVNVRSVCTTSFGGPLVPEVGNTHSVSRLAARAIFQRLHGSARPATGTAIGGAASRYGRSRRLQPLARQPPHLVGPTWRAEHDPVRRAVQIDQRRGR